MSTTLTEAQLNRARHLAQESATSHQDDSTEFVVPEGKRVEFTGAGQPYLVNANGEADEDSDDAAGEHKRAKLSFMVPLADLERMYGIGTRIYFHFLLFIVFTNIVLGILTGIPYLFYTQTRDCATSACGPLGDPALGALHEVWCFERLGQFLITPDSYDASLDVCALSNHTTYDPLRCAASGDSLLPVTARPRVSRLNPFGNTNPTFSELFVGA